MNGPLVIVAAAVLAAALVGMFAGAFVVWQVMRGRSPVPRLPARPRAEKSDGEETPQPRKARL